MTRQFFWLQKMWSLLALLCILSSPTFADPYVSNGDIGVQLSNQEKIYLQKKQFFTYVCDPEWIPYDFLDNRGQHAGIAAEYMKLIAQRLNISFQRLPTKSRLESLALAHAGECDILSWVDSSDFLLDSMRFTAPICRSKMLIVGSENIQLHNGLDDISSEIIVVVDGLMMDRYLQSHFPNIHRVRVQSTREALDAVQKGKAFATLISEREALFLRHNSRFSRLHILGESRVASLYRLGVRKNDQVLLSVIQKALDSISADEHKRIHDKWAKKISITQPQSIAKLITFLVITAVFFSAGMYLYRKGHTPLP